MGTPEDRPDCRRGRRSVALPDGFRPKAAVLMTSQDEVAAGEVELTSACAIGHHAGVERALSGNGEDPLTTQSLEN